jgi:hypothetical protein
MAHSKIYGKCQGSGCQKTIEYQAVALVASVKDYIYKYVSCYNLIGTVGSPSESQTGDKPYLSRGDY